jgi:hypothetical protein
MNTTTITSEVQGKSISKESLFAIGEHFYALESLIIERDGEIDETIDQWLSEYEAKEEAKLDAYCYIIAKHQEIAEEAQRLAERAARHKQMVTQLKDRLKYYLESRGKDKVETKRFTIKVCANGGPLPIALSPGIEGGRPYRKNLLE